MGQFNIGDKVWLYEHTYVVELCTVSSIKVFENLSCQWIIVELKDGSHREVLDSYLYSYPEDRDRLVDDIEYDVSMMMRVAKDILKTDIEKQ